MEKKEMDVDLKRLISESWELNNSSGVFFDTVIEMINKYYGDSGVDLNKANKEVTIETLKSLSELAEKGVILELIA